MADVPLYLLRLVQYPALMLLFGLPLLQWQADRGRRRGDGDAAAPGPDRRALHRWLLACALAALALNAAEAPLKAMHLLGLSLPELDGPALAWYALGTAAGWAWLVRGVLLLSIAGLLAWWPGPRALPLRSLCAASGLALATLLWNGHAAASSGTAGLLRLGVGGLHLLAAAAWLGAILGFLTMLRTGWPNRGDTGTLRRWHDRLHAFAATGSVLVAVLAVSGGIHYAWILEWRWSAATLLGTPYGRWMLFKLALFAGMLALAALHRWVLVPRLVAMDTNPDDPVRLRRSLRLEAAAAAFIVAAVAVLGTMSPHG